MLRQIAWENGVLSAHRVKRALASWRIPVYRLQGPTRASGKPGTVLTAGDEPSVHYLTNRFFAVEPERQRLGRIPAWGLSRKLEEWRSSADLVVARVDRLSARLFFPGDYLRVPEWVGTWLSLAPGLTEIVQTNKSIRSDMNRMRRHEYRMVVSHTDGDFDAFYSDLYVPYITSRHGEWAVPRPRGSLWRHFHRGALLWVERDGQRAGGMIVEPRQNTLRLMAIGLADGESPVAEPGDTPALYYHSMRYAVQQGCDQIDLGGCRPCLQDGLLRYKRKWSVAVGKRSDIHFMLLLHWNLPNDIVTDFFAHTPLMFVENNGLSALHGLSACRAKRILDMPGLQRMVHVADLMKPT